jgi:tetratricopeptide (TPR) repeat protein
MIVDHKERLAEIRDIIWDNWYSNDVDDKFFMGIESELHEIHKATKDNDCLWLISELYHFRVDQSKRKVSHYAFMALEADPNNAGIHDNVMYGNNVRINNFKTVDHNKLIEFYKTFITDHPDSLIAHRILLECLIDNYRFAEALNSIDVSRSRFPSQAFLWDLYHGEVLFKSGEQKQALELWERTCVDNKESHLCVSMLGEYYANFGLYDDALIKYAAAFELQKPPRKIDDLTGTYIIYAIRKEYAKSLATIDRIIEVYKTDWDTMNGIDIDDLIGEKNKIISKMSN